MIRLNPILLLLFQAAILFSCTSTRLVDHWQDPETPVYAAGKILVVGMSADDEIRRSFEEQLKTSFEAKGIVAVRSIDFFESSFTDSKTTEDDLDAVEYDLLEAGFDVILVTKVTGVEDRVNMVQAMRGFTRDFMNFREYYYSNQEVFNQGTRESYQVYHTETSVFCICPGKDRNLLWRGQFDVTDPYNRKRSISDYVRVLTAELKDNRMLIVP